MKWFSGILTQYMNKEERKLFGYVKKQEWIDISFTEAVEIADKIRKDDPTAEFIYNPYPTTV